MSDVKLPLDATGKEIPLDTKVLYAKDGSSATVVRFIYNVSLDEWGFRYRVGNELLERDCIRDGFNEFVYLDQPDSWERLLKDLNNEGVDVVCNYFGFKNSACLNCPADGHVSCTKVMLRDIADRIRALRGDVK